MLRKLTTRFIDISNKHLGATQIQSQHTSKVTVRFITTTRKASRTKLSPKTAANKTLGGVNNIIMPSTITTHFMIISDTHSYTFGDKKWARVPFQHPLPKCDVLLHCGDLTMNGELEKLEGVIEMLGSIEAEVKLVIAGNHDRTLDGPHWRTYCGGDVSEDDDASQDSFEVYFEDHARAVNIMTGEAAKKAGVTYLEEGIHAFSLKNGAKFTMYASPYQPEFCGYAFSYERDEDRFNPASYVMDGVKEIQGNKIPDFPGVDIIMTHGPPKGIMDSVHENRLIAHVGCDALMTACSRARPLLYCFGHIHEGYGANIVTWKDDPTILGEHAVEKIVDKPSIFPDVLDARVNFGKETLMLNAAIRDVNYWPKNAPWVVDLELPRA